VVRKKIWVLESGERLLSVKTSTTTVANAAANTNVMMRDIKIGGSIVFIFPLYGDFRKKRVVHASEKL
jgi:hypothetical protein